MNSKIKKLLATSLIVLTIPAISIGSARADEKQTPLTLQGAVQIGLKNSNDIKSAQLSLESAQNILTDTVKKVGDLEDYRKFRADIANVDKYYLEYSQEVTVATAVAQAELGINLSKSTIEDAKRLTRLNIEKGYYEVAKAQQNLINAQRSLERADKVNKQVKVKYQAGMASQNDTTSSDIDLANAQSTVNICEYSLKSALVGLSDSLGINVEQGYTFDADTSFKQFDRSKEQDLIDFAVKNSPSLYRASQERIIAEETLTVASSGGNATQENKRDAELAVRDKSIKETAAKNTVIKDVRQALLNVYIAEEGYVTTQNSLKTASDNYKVASQLYEIGNKTYLDVQAAQLLLNKAEADVNKALFDYKLALSNVNLKTSGALDTTLYNTDK